MCICVCVCVCFVLILTGDRVFVPFSFSLTHKHTQPATTSHQQHQQRQHSVRSLRSDVSVMVKFVSKLSDCAVDLLWIDFNGHEVFYNTLPPLGQLEMQTFETHPWCWRPRKNQLIDQRKEDQEKEKEEDEEGGGEEKGAAAAAAAAAAETKSEREKDCENDGNVYVTTDEPQQTVTMA